MSEIQDLLAKLKSVKEQESIANSNTCNTINSTRNEIKRIIKDFAKEIKPLIREIRHERYEFIRYFQEELEGPE